MVLGALTQETDRPGYSRLNIENHAHLKTTLRQEGKGHHESLENQEKQNPWIKI